MKLRTVIGVIEKKYSVCGAWKPLTAFSPGGASHQGSEGGVHCECKPCHAKRHRDRRAAARLVARISAGTILTLASSAARPVRIFQLLSKLPPTSLQSARI
jgi:hypothetical protein